MANRGKGGRERDRVQENRARAFEGAGEALGSESSLTIMITRRRLWHSKEGSRREGATPANLLRAEPGRQLGEPNEGPEKSKIPI